MNRVVIGRSEPFVNYPTIRAALKDVIELRDYNGLGSITLKSMQSQIMHTFQDVHLYGTSRAFEFNQARFTGCVIDESLTMYNAAFSNCYFLSCTIILNGTSDAHSVFQHCEFKWCTIVALSEDAGLRSLFGGCTFIDDIPAEEKALLGDYYDPNVLPAYTEFYAWKKVCYRTEENGKIGEAMLKLHVPRNASRVRGIGGEDKIRVSRAAPVAAYSIHREIPEGGDCYQWAQGEEFTPEMYERYVLFSSFDSTFTYTVGIEARPEHPFNHAITEVCASGIHCFVSLDRALQYGV